MSVPAVEFRDVSMRFGDIEALSGVNLTVEEGAYMVLLGPSGGGKTTLLNILGGFLEPSGGRVLIRGEDLTHAPPARRPTTTVFQDYALFPHMNVAGNVAFGLKMRRVPKREQQERVAQALDLVGLAHTAGQRTHALSGGQRQRIALARALVVEPSVLLLDEPLGALDMKLRRQMQHELKIIQQRVGTTFVHVTHDQEEAMAIADTIVVMNQGSIEDLGPPERIYLRPVSRFTADFMGDSNLIEGQVVTQRDAQLTVRSALGEFELPGVAEPGTWVTLAIRPEHLHTDPGDGRLGLGNAQVLECGFYGTHHQCDATLASLPHPIKVRIDQKRLLQPGDVLPLYLDPSDLVVLAR